MRFWRHEVSIRYGDLRIVASAYILVPLFIFLAGFLRWYFALPGLCVAGYALYAICRQRDRGGIESRAIELRLGSLALILLLMLVWTYFGGMNGIFYQTSDWRERNAVFHDLIFHRWPVVYENNNTALVYYVGHWLFPALIGKLANLLFGSARVAWLFGRMALWAWSSIGLSILALLLFTRLDARTRRSRFAVLAIFILFSGMDLLGALLYKQTDRLFSPDVLHLEWWAREGYQFTSITACVYWVFNQSIVPWIVTGLFLLDEDERNYVVYGAACLICGPLPLVGLALLMLGRAAIRLFASLKRSQIKAWAATVFSRTNIAAIVVLMPLVAVYLLGSGIFTSTRHAFALGGQTDFFSGAYWNKHLLVFYFCEVGGYLLLMWTAHRKDPLYYLVALSLLCIPYFHVGNSTDFCMRASLPGVFVTMVYAMDFLLHPPKELPFRRIGAKLQGRAITACRLALILALLLGAATPCVEIYRGFYHVITQGTVKLAQNSLWSFDEVERNAYFLATNVDQHFFYCFLAR